MALGADRPGVIGLVLNSAFRKVGIGLLLGIPLSIGAGRLISSQLYNVTGWDPIALAVAIVVTNQSGDRTGQPTSFAPATTAP